MEKRPIASAAPFVEGWTQPKAVLLTLRPFLAAAASRIRVTFFCECIGRLSEGLRKLHPP
jgi:hypothetical protein